MAGQSRLYNVKAIVLGRRDQGEADRVILCLAPDGRFDFLAKRGKEVALTKSRTSGIIQHFRYGDLKG